MGRRYYDRTEVANTYTANISDMLKYFEGKKPMNVEELKTAYEAGEKAYTEELAKSIELKRKIKNSTFLKNHYKKKRSALQSKLQEMNLANTAFSTALELCELLNVQDTSTFAPSMLTEELLNKIIDSKIEAEKAHNEQVEKTGEGKKSKKYAGLYEEFDESQYPFLNME